jgi:hypothetical protein
MQVLTEAEEFDTENVDTHQADSYMKTLLHKANSITSGTNQADVFNIIGQLNTLRRLKGLDALPASEFLE